MKLGSVLRWTQFISYNLSVFCMEKRAPAEPLKKGECRCAKAKRIQSESYHHYR